MNIHNLLVTFFFVLLSMPYHMDKKKKDDARKVGVTERGIMLIEECKKFIKKNKDFLDITKENIDNIQNVDSLEKDREILDEILKKIEWYQEQIEIERKKSCEPFELLDKFVIKKERRSAG